MTKPYLSCTAVVLVLLSVASGLSHAKLLPRPAESEQAPRGIDEFVRLASLQPLRTEREYREAAGEFERSLMLRAYDAIHAGQDTWSEVDRALIAEGAARHVTTESEGAFFAQFREPRWREHPDPQFRAWFWAVRRHEFPRDPDAPAAIDALIEEMRERGCSPLRIAGLALGGRVFKINIANDLEDGEAKAEELRKVNAWYFSIVARTAALPGLDSIGRRYICEKFLDSYLLSTDKPVRDHCAASLLAQPELDPWFRHYVSGSILVSEAWVKRGTATASRTTPEQFAAFHADLDLAISELTAAWTIDPGVPQVPCRMLTARMPRSSTWGDEGWRWFARAIAADIESSEAWARMRTALEPRWQGDGDDHTELCEWANQPEFYHTSLGLNTLYQFTRKDFDLMVDRGEPDGAYSSERLVRAVIESFEGMLAQNAPIDTDYARTTLAWFYHKQGRTAEAARHVRDLGGRVSRGAQTRLRIEDQHLPGLILPAVSAGAAMAERAEVLESMGDWRSAIVSWEQAVIACEEDGDTLAASASRDRLLRAQRQHAFDSGEWLDMTFEESMAGWRAVSGDWKRIDSRTVEVRSAVGDFAILTADVFTGQRFEIEVTATFNRRPLSRGGAAAAVFHRGTRVTDRFNIWRTAAAWPYVDRAAIAWAFGRDNYANLHCPFPEDGRYQIRVLVDGTTCEGLVNGVEFESGEIPNHRPGKEADDMRFGLGAFSLGVDTNVRFTDLRIRRLPEVEAP